MLRSIVLALGAALIALQTAPASAQQVCGERAKIMSHLEENFAEQPIAMGLTSAGEALEVFTSISGTWTFLVTHTDGRTCMVASGESWETLPIRPAGQIS